MTRRGVFAAAAALSLAGWTASAQPAPAPPAPSEGFAVIVTNNRSVERTRPDLQYADDDGVQYARLFGRLLGAEHVRLLTDLDVSSRRLYGSEPAAQARPPTGTELDAAVGWAAERIGAARRAGARTAFYFVFAGHGDVERGQGFLELIDGRLDARGIEARVLSRVGADATHVILDSCNSFFVISPRRPGGRRWATARDAAMGLSGRLPNVGVFLSTSAEADVFEWSELQSGIFSHLVRSGLAGGADADGDGLIRYDELSAFVATATATVANDLYRPRLFSRGPGGRGSEVLVGLHHAPGQRLRVAAPGRRRLTLRDAEGVRVLDVHKDDGVALSLVVERELTVEEQRTGATERPERLAYNLAAAEGAELVLVPSVPAAAPRGPEGIFRQLFAEPFGPAKVAAYQAEQAQSTAAPVYGIARQDVAEMRAYVGSFATSDRSDRIMTAATTAAYGALSLAGGAALQGIEAHGLLDSSWSWTAYGLYGLATLLAGSTVYSLLTRYAAEDLHDGFELALARGDDPSQVAARVELDIERIGRRERTRRAVTFGVALALAAGSVVGLAVNELSHGSFDPWVGRIYGALGLMAGASWAVRASLVASFPERLLTLWRTDPALGGSVAIAPVLVPGGAGVTIVGSLP